MIRTFSEEHGGRTTLRRQAQNGPRRLRCIAADDDRVGRLDELSNGRRRRVPRNRIKDQVPTSNQKSQAFVHVLTRMSEPSVRPIHQNIYGVPVAPPALRQRKQMGRGTIDREENPHLVEPSATSSSV